MGAVVGPNVGLSNFIGREIVRRVAEDADVGNVCKSTEGLVNKFETYNNDRVEKEFHEKNVIIASMDIKKWFPSTLARPSGKEGIDYDAVARYLGEHLSKEEIVKENLEEIVYIKKENVNKKKKQNRSKKTLNTKACGGDLVDETLANGDELKSAHKTVNRSNKMENKRRKPWTPKKVGAPKLMLLL